MKRARVKTLPADLQHVNLCRLHTSVMDALGVRPGDLLLVEVTDSNKELSRTEGRGDKSLARLWVRCPNIALAAGQNELPEVEIDPCLMTYLDVKDNDVVALQNNFREEILSVITFETASTLPKEEETELRQLIQHARWPVYSGAFFAVNLSGRPVDLMMTSQCPPLAVIGPGTLISILNQRASEELHLHNEILAVEMALHQARKQKALLHLEIGNLRKEEQRTLYEQRGYDKTIEALSKQRERLRDELANVPRRKQELREACVSLDQENQRLQNILRALETEELPDLNLKERDAAHERVRKSIKTGLDEFEKKVQDAQQQLKEETRFSEN